MDLARAMRDPDSAEALLAFLTPALDPDCEVVIDLGGAGEVRTRSGPSGMREAWLEWMAPWASYRTEIEEAIDLGDRVVLLVRDFGRYQPGGPEAALTGAAIWTVRDHRIVRAEFYANREAGMRAAGLSDPLS